MGYSILEGDLATTGPVFPATTAIELGGIDSGLAGHGDVHLLQAGHATLVTRPIVFSAALQGDGVS